MCDKTGSRVSRRPGVVCLCGGVAIILLLAAIFPAAIWQRNLAVQEKTGRLLTKTTILSDNLEPRIVSRLAAAPAETDTPEYERLQVYFEKLISFLDYRSIWSAGLINDELVYGPFEFAEDKTPETSEENRENYRGLNESEIRQVFETGRPVVRGPDSDPSSSEFSVAVPVVAPRTGEVQLVIGMTCDSPEWRSAVRRQQFIVAFALLLPAFFIFAGCLRDSRVRRCPDLKQRLLFRYWEVWVIIGCGLPLSGAVALAMYDYQSRQRRDNFYHLTDRESRTVARAFRNLRDHQMDALARLYQINPAVDSRDFENFTRPIIREHAIQALAWAEAVPKDQKREFEEVVRVEKGNDYRIWERAGNKKEERQPAAGRDVFYAVREVAPLAENRAALGFDIGSESRCRAALERAVEQGMATATERMELVSGRDARKGILILQPIFKPGREEPAGRAEASPRGLALAGLRLEPFLEVALHRPSPSFFTGSVSLHQVHAHGAVERLAVVAEPLEDVNTGEKEISSWKAGFAFSAKDMTAATPLFMFGNLYLVKSEPSAAFFTAMPIYQWITIFVGGSLLTFVLALFNTYVTRRRIWMESEINARTEELSATLYSIGDAVIATDGQSRVRRVNPIAETLTGWSEDESRGRPLTEVFRIFNEISGAPAPDPVARVLREGAVVGLANHTMLLNRDQTQRPIADSAAPIHNKAGDIIGVVLVFRDQTQERESRRALEESGQKYRQINRILGVIRKINQLIIREQSTLPLIQKACDVLVEHRDYNAAMIILTDKDDSQRVKTYAESGMDKQFAPLADRLNQGELPACCEEARQATSIAVIAEDKNQICAACPVLEQCREHTTLCVALSENGNIVGYLMVTLTASTGLRLEEHDLFAELAGDLTYALHAIDTEEARHEAEAEKDALGVQLQQAQKMEAVGRLAGGVAHDFNNMLAIIMGNAEMALMELEEGKPIKQELETISDTAKRSADLTQQLLAFARKQTIAPKILELNETVSEMLKMLERLSGEDITFNWRPSDESINIKLDPAQLNQILANLIVNARDAMSENDGGEIMIETGTAEFNETCFGSHFEILPGRYAVIAISDNGIGIDKETMSHLFEPFFTTKKPGQGTGLGLPTVYGIVKQNEGFVNVYSELGKGTAFRIYLPLYYEEEGKQKRLTETEQKPAKGGSETILLVEDEEVLLDLAEKMLSQLGYRVLAASGVSKALEIHQDWEKPIDLLLTDVVLPESNGRELSRKISVDRPGIKCLFISGYTANTIAKHGILEDNINFLEKPFSKKTLDAKVREVLDAPSG